MTVCLRHKASNSWSDQFSNFFKLEQKSDAFKMEFWFTVQRETHKVDLRIPVTKSIQWGFFLRRHVSVFCFETRVSSNHKKEKTNSRWLKLNKICQKMPQKCWKLRKKPFFSEILPKKVTIMRNSILEKSLYRGKLRPI